jgi:mannosyltransferase
MYQSATHITLLFLAIILALGTFLRLYRIGENGLWIDEAFSIWMGRQPVGEMLNWLVRIDQHPPLYYLLLHLWMRLGKGEAIVRALSALCSTLTIPAIYFLGRRLAGRRLGLLAALILAVSPFHVHLAQEARMYSLLALNASLALYALACLLTDPRAAKLALGRQTIDFWRMWRATCRRPPLRTIETDLAWLAYALFTAATLLTHNMAVFFPLATNVFVFSWLLIYRLFPSPSQTPTLFPRNWLLAQAGIFLLWLTWLPAFISQSMGVYREFWLPPPTLETVVGTVGVFVSEFLPLPLWGFWIAGAFCMALVVMSVVYFGHRPARAAFLLVVFAAPILGAWLVSLRCRIFYDRTLIWASLPLYVLLAAGISRLRRWPLVLAGLLMVLAANGLSLHEYYVHFEKEEWDDAAAFVAQRAEPDDLILFNATWMQLPFDYYFHRLNDVPVVEHGVPVDLFDRDVLEPKMAESDLPYLRDLVSDRDRVWLVYSHYWYTDPDGLIPPALEGALDLQDRWEFYGVQVWLYAAPPD